LFVFSGTTSADVRPAIGPCRNYIEPAPLSILQHLIDRLGRSLIDLLGTIQALEACGVDLYLDQQAIDTTTPAGKLMFQVTGAFAEFERSMIRQRVRAGLKRALERGATLGRPKISPDVERRIQSKYGLAKAF
jgi:DNA invertase Pin-like site-specific DNA recombinase